MQPLRQWSFKKVVLVAVACLLAGVAGTIAWIVYLFVRGSAVEVSEGASVAAVSIGISEAILVIPFIVPIGLVFAWFVSRRLNAA